ncbi:serine/threonine protein kinase [Streptosporangium amethystogenes]|uniref:serine/threonine protein kinase n=1 Tax=Streptosporangium amethystogenes TaxID=2002 RepID=UPI0014706F28|nr:serine/threonine-protein kinase [Streptosporangium amethystogenes]
MPAGPLEPGDPRVLGEFEVVGRLGEGGQGIVYEGWSRSGERVAIKVLRSGSDPATRRRLARELQSALRVAPFCTARVLAAETDRLDPYVVSEFIAGPALQDRVRDEGPLRGGDLDRLAVATATALAAIHSAGVIHRDFKPANVLLGPDGPRVVDFGIAQLLDASTMPSALSGTPPYMAPEQLNGVHGSPAADVFSWAATMVYAATGRPPFGSDTVAAVFSRILNAEPDLTDISSPLRETLTVCLAKDPGVRPSARALMIRLVDSGAPTVTVPDVGPVPTAYLPADWSGRADQVPVVAGPGPTRTLPADSPGAQSPAGPAYGPAPTRHTGPSDTAVRETAPQHGEPVTRRGRRSAAVLITITGIVAVLVAAAVLYVTGTLGGSPGDDPAITGTGGDAGSRSVAGGRSSSGAQSSGAPATPTSVQPGGGVPEAFAGTWTGQVVSQDDRKKTVDITLTLPPGRSAGTWRADACEQQVMLTRARAGNVLDLTRVQRDQCVGGDMTLTLKDPATLDFVGQEGVSGLEYRGSLSRS